MVWVAAGQSMDYTLRLRWPIRGCESESIIRSSIHSVNLHYFIQLLIMFIALNWEFDQ